MGCDLAVGCIRQILGEFSDDLGANVLRDCCPQITESCRRRNDDEVIVGVMLQSVRKHFSELVCELCFKVPVWIGMRLIGRAPGAMRAEAPSLAI